MLRRCTYSSLEVPLYFALWYVLNIVYNITNKWALDDVREFVGYAFSKDGAHVPGMLSSLPITIGCMQFAIGSLYACTLWILGWKRPIPHAEEVSIAAKSCIERRKSCSWVLRGQTYSSLERSDSDPPDPENSPANHFSSSSLRDTFHIAIHHTLGQLCTVLSLSLNSISFAHVIKAMEPFFSAIASRLCFGKQMDIRVYLALIPVVGGVIMAIAGSDEFSWPAFWFGIGSNGFFAMRAVSSKLAMDRSKIRSEDKHDLRKSCSNDDIDFEADHDTIMENNHQLSQSEAMCPSNLFAAVTIVSFFLSIPLVVVFEGKILLHLLNYSTNGSNAGNNRSNERTILYILSSGLFHYLNNQVMFLAVSNVHPITLAVGNTMKRVFIIISGIVVFSTPVTWQTAVGSTIGICGVLLYSLMKQWYDSDTCNVHFHNEADDANMTELPDIRSNNSGLDKHLVSRKH
ncbi:hypothetical protein HJC23_005944 [Cyclotella cryptica]|uniref:Sugar phosphate transporter domain-containing protein n=1 Tax=Cyclotella cryptica TaxID=29204 RepID=A0ABD3QZH6_9STRA